MKYEMFFTNDIPFLYLLLHYFFLKIELHQEPGLTRNIVSPKSNNLEKKSLKFRCFIYDITQHILFKRASATLVVANCFLLFFPVSYIVTYF